MDISFGLAIFSMGLFLHAETDPAWIAAEDVWSCSPCLDLSRSVSGVFQSGNYCSWLSSEKR